MPSSAPAPAPESFSTADADVQAALLFTQEAWAREFAILHNNLAIACLLAPATCCTMMGHGLRYRLDSGECLDVPEVQRVVHGVQVQGGRVAVKPGA